MKDTHDNFLIFLWGFSLSTSVLSTNPIEKTGAILLFALIFIIMNIQIWLRK